MKSIRVLHITPSVRLLGARRSLLGLVKELAGTRFEPLVLVPRPGPLTEELDMRHLPWVALELPPWRKGSSWLRLPAQVAALRALLRDRRIDLIHCNEIYPNPHAVAATSAQPLWRELFGNFVIRRRVGAPELPIVTHNRLSVTPRMIRNYLLGEATRLIAVSQAAAADFAAQSWFAEKVRVVYNGIDFEEIERAAARRGRVRERLGVEPDDILIGSIGLLMPRKRPRFILEAAPAILQAVPRARFLFVGDPSPRQEAYLDELKRHAEQLGVATRVIFLPFQERIAEIFPALDIHVLLSNDEGFGRVVIEAAAARVPTIGSNVGGIRELIVPGETGYLIGGDDAADDKAFAKHADDFVGAVVELAKNPALRRAMGEAACEHCRAHFSLERYVEGVTRVFDEALAEFDATRPPW
jgi:glycosyltransferase involved in cell wall biosynthesis